MAEDEEEVYLNIPISKGKDLYVRVELNKLIESLPLEVLTEVYLQGIKHVVNARGMSKQSSAKTLTGNELEKANAILLAIAEDNLVAMQKGEIRITGGKAKTKGMERQVKTEAMRLAKLAVKDAIKAEGKVKVSHIPAKQITALATELIESDQGDDFIAQAKENLAVREKKEAALKIDISGLKADPTLVAKSKAKGKGPLAGVLAKAKPPAGQHAAH